MRWIANPSRQRLGSPFHPSGGRDAGGMHAALSQLSYEQYADASQIRTVAKKSSCGWVASCGVTRFFRAIHPCKPFF